MKVFLFILAVSACGPKRAPPPVLACTPATTGDCQCDDGAHGTQACADDGARWLACDCAHALVITMPALISAGAFFDVAVQMVDDLGQPVSDDASVEIIHADATLLGRRTETLAGGTAVVHDLRMERAYAQTHVSARVGGITSDGPSFTVLPGAAATIALTSLLPSPWDLGVQIQPPPTIEARDTFGNVASASAEPITVELSAGGDVFRLFGTTLATLHTGHAVFDRLQLRGAVDAQGSATLRFVLNKNQSVTADVVISEPDLAWARFAFASTYELAADTVTDTRSGLVWAKTTAAAQTYAAATASCAGLAPSDGESWRLPTYAEALSLLSDARPFTATVRTQSGTAGAHFIVDLSTGQTAIVADSVLQTALCVLATAQGRAAPSRPDAAPAGQFELVLDGTEAVIDHRTQLMWQRSDNACGDCSVASADATCEALVSAAFDDWRLPSIRELGSLLAIRAGPPRWDGQIFAGAAGSYWSSTPSGNGQLAIDFATGLLAIDGPASGRHVRCVRTLTP